MCEQHGLLVLSKQPDLGLNEAASLHKETLLITWPPRLLDVCSALQKSSHWPLLLRRQALCTSKSKPQSSTLKEADAGVSFLTFKTREQTLDRHEFIKGLLETNQLTFPCNYLTSY